MLHVGSPLAFGTWVLITEDAVIIRISEKAARALLASGMPLEG